MTTITATQAKDLLLKSWSEFNEDQAPRLGAALAYYTPVVDIMFFPIRHQLYSGLAELEVALGNQSVNMAFDFRR